MLLEQARLSQDMRLPSMMAGGNNNNNSNLEMQHGLFPDSFHMDPHQHAALPHFHSYPGPQPTLQVFLHTLVTCGESVSFGCVAVAVEGGGGGDFDVFTSSEKLQP
jgi:hypothetical protein